MQTATRIVRASKKSKSTRKENAKRAKNFGTFAGSEQVKEDIRREKEQQGTSAEQVFEDPWVTEAKRLDREEQEKTMSRDELRDIWIKPGNDWGVEDIMDDDAKNQKQIEKYSEVYRKKTQSTGQRHQSR